MGALLENLIVGFLALLNEFFNTDIFAHDIACPVEQQQGQQAAHTAVTVVKGMNTEKVQNEHRDQQQRIHVILPHSLLVGPAEAVHRLRRLPGRERLKANRFVSLFVLLCNHIVQGFIMSTVGRAAKFIEVPVELQDHRCFWRDIVKALMNGGQYIPVTGDLLLVPGTGGSFVLHQLFQALVRSINTLDFVGGLGALDLGDFHQFSQGIGFGLDKQGLFSFVFMDLSQQGHDIWGKQLLIVFGKIVGAHPVPHFRSILSFFL